MAWEPESSRRVSGRARAIAVRRLRMGSVLGVLDMTRALGGAFRESLLEFAVESLESKFREQPREKSKEPG